MKKNIKSLLASFLMLIMVFLLKLPAQASTAETFSPVFNSTFYAEKYADIAAVYGKDESLLLQHFLSCGMTEGRQGNEEFNVEIYRNNYPDLITVFGDDLTLYYMHYILSGKTEGRIASHTLLPQTPTTNTSSTDTTTVHPMFTENQWNFANRVIELVNIERNVYGLGSVSGLHNLSSAAQARAKEILDLFSHTRPNGSSCFSIFDEYNVKHGYAGENIAAGQNTPEEVVNAWMNSPGHRANIMNKNYTHLGVGCYTEDNSHYGIYWCQMFTD